MRFPLILCRVSSNLSKSYSKKVKNLIFTTFILTLRQIWELAAGRRLANNESADGAENRKCCRISNLDKLFLKCPGGVA
jgi:hypothetical protein